MRESEYRDAAGNLVTARTFERLSQESKVSGAPVHVVTNIVYNTPRDASPSPGPTSSEHLRTLPGQRKSQSPVRRQSGRAGAASDGPPCTADSPLSAWRRSKPTSQAAPSQAGRERQGERRASTEPGPKTTGQARKPTTEATRKPGVSPSKTYAGQAARRSKPAWTDLPVDPPNKVVTRERVPTITGPTRRQSNTLLAGDSTGQSSRLSTPLRPKVPPLNWGAATASPSAQPESREAGDLARDAAPRRSGSILDDGSGQLPRLSRTGGLTPRGSGLSGPAHSRQLGSPRDTIPSITAQRADTAASGHSEISTPSKLVALAPATPAVQPISRQPDAAGSIQAGVLHGRGRIWTREGSEEKDHLQGSEVDATNQAPLSSRLGRRRTSGNGSRRASAQGGPIHEVKRHGSLTRNGDDEASTEARRPTATSLQQPSDVGKNRSELRTSGDEASGSGREPLSKAQSLQSPRIGTPRRLVSDPSAAASTSARPHGNSRQRTSGASLASSRARTSSGLIPPVPSTRDGWVKEDSILAHSASEVAGHKQQFPEIWEDGMPAKELSIPTALRSTASLQKRKSFLSRPGPSTGPVQCTIVRETGESRSHPTYKLYLDDPSEFVMAARKRKKSKTSKYVMSVDARDLQQDTLGCCGKVRSNFLGTQFVLYDTSGAPAPETGTPAPHEVGIVRYQHNVLGTRGPRKMTVIIPRLNSAGRVPPLPGGDGSMTERLKNKGAEHELLVLKNKAPRWNDQLGAYCLNFGGRVTHASVKNFQLVSEADQETVLLQFGKVGKDKFSMDFMSPMSAVQAFGVCLSSFDSKLACE